MESERTSLTPNSTQALKLVARETRCGEPLDPLCSPVRDHRPTTDRRRSVGAAHGGDAALLGAGVFGAGVGPGAARGSGDGDGVLRRSWGHGRGWNGRHAVWGAWMIIPLTTVVVSHGTHCAILAQDNLRQHKEYLSMPESRCSIAHTQHGTQEYKICRRLHAQTRLP